ncbi:hypothetical protein B0H10DRAFT_2430722 [Mycena sp. CBHHK59/15]|nr:hypothetical protein B0H10DRAFT_2430722 [Mycena sp. CBHHK59/15]
MVIGYREIHIPLLADCCPSDSQEAARASPRSQGLTTPDRREPPIDLRSTAHPPGTGMTACDRKTSGARPLRLAPDIAAPRQTRYHSTLRARHRFAVRRLGAPRWREGESAASARSGLPPRLAFDRTPLKIHALRGELALPRAQRRLPPREPYARRFWRVVDTPQRPEPTRRPRPTGRRGALCRRLDCEQRARSDVLMRHATVACWRSTGDSTVCGQSARTNQSDVWIHKRDPRKMWVRTRPAALRTIAQCPTADSGSRTARAARSPPASVLQCLPTDSPVRAGKRCSALGAASAPRAPLGAAKMRRTRAPAPPTGAPRRPTSPATRPDAPSPHVRLDNLGDSTAARTGIDPGVRRGADAQMRGSRVCGYRALDRTFVPNCTRCARPEVRKEGGGALHRLELARRVDGRSLRALLALQTRTAVQAVSLGGRLSEACQSRRHRCASRLVALRKWLRCVRLGREVEDARTRVRRGGMS